MGQIARIHQRTSRSAQRRGGSGYAQFSPAFLDELRDRTSLSGLISRTVKLTRAGNEFKACCPFHNEKTPSFYVNDDKGFYHCFGCTAHGDAIRFLTEAEGLGFVEAVKQLAEAAGMDVPQADPDAQAVADHAATIGEAVEAAQKWFAAQLQGIDGAAARAYLERRGITPDTLVRYGFGFAPEGRARLRSALKAIGDPTLIDAGLLISVDEKEPYDRFRGRVMIPIRDVKGRMIAFGGRIIKDGEPKYLNSPDTALFDKGRTLFNLDRAAQAARKSGRIIAVEGYLDAIALDQAGIGEVVAPLGTAMTDRQMALMWRLVDAPLLCFDGDGAGQKAAVRAAKRALPLLLPGKSLRFATLPVGEDPDDVIRRGGGAAFEGAIEHPASLEEVLYRDAVATRIPVPGDEKRHDKRAALRQDLEELASTCTDRIVADEIRRSLRGLFFEDFGWKKEERRVIANAIIRTSPLRHPELGGAYVRSMLYGLTRYPRVLLRHIETIDRVNIVHPAYAAWRDVLVTALARDPILDHDGVRAILETHQMEDALRGRSLCLDLRFGFTQAGADSKAAEQQLSGLVEFLGEEGELDEELASLDREAVADAAGPRYEAIESARQRARERRFALREQGFQLGSTNL